MRNFQKTFETRDQSFISAFSICMNVPLTIFFELSYSILEPYRGSREIQFLKFSIPLKINLGFWKPYLNNSSLFQLFRKKGWHGKFFFNVGPSILTNTLGNFELNFAEQIKWRVSITGLKWVKDQFLKTSHDSRNNSEESTEALDLHLNTLVWIKNGISQLTT